MKYFYLDILLQFYGFIRGKSTLINLLIFNNCLSEALEHSQQVDAIYTDISKAFDKVNHKRLLSKIWNFSVRGNLFKLICSYLNNRMQAVRIYNCIAKPFNLTSGVPEGSYLGPFIFFVYINDIVNHIKHAHILVYACDIKMFTVTNSVEASRLLEADIKSVAKWCDENGLILNTSKCSIISYHLLQCCCTRTYTQRTLIRVERASSVLKSCIPIGQFQCKVNGYTQIDQWGYWILKLRHVRHESMSTGCTVCGPFDCTLAASSLTSTINKAFSRRKQKR